MSDPPIITSLRFKCRSALFATLVRYTDQPSSYTPDLTFSRRWFTQPIKTVKKTLERVFSENELHDEVRASVQARGGNPDIVKVVAWDPASKVVITEDIGRCGLPLMLAKAAINSIATVASEVVIQTTLRCLAGKLDQPFHMGKSHVAYGGKSGRVTCMRTTTKGVIRVCLVHGLVLGRFTYPRLPHVAVDQEPRGWYLFWITLLVQSRISNLRCLCRILGLVASMRRQPDHLDYQRTPS